MAYNTELRRMYRDNEIAKNGLYALNRKQQLNRAKRLGFVTVKMLNKYGFNDEELPFLSHAILDDNGRCCCR